jgi:hypothetical protein
VNRIPADARIPVVITRSSPARRDESAPSAPGQIGESQSRLTSTLRSIVTEDGSATTIIVPPEEVRARFERVKLLKDISVTQRGWTLDVLNVVLGSARASRAANDTPVVGIWGTETAQNRSLHPICSPRGRDEPQAGRPCSPFHPRTGKTPSR